MKFWLLTLMIFFIFLFISVGVPIIAGELSKNCTEVEVCYKVEYNFWGKHYVEVDADSSSCEIKQMECRIW